MTCIPGRSLECTAPGGCAGGQICKPDGKSFGPCVCSDGGSGSYLDADRDASVDSKAKGAAGAPNTKVDAAGSSPGEEEGKRDASADRSVPRATDGAASPSVEAASEEPHEGSRDGSPDGSPDDGATWTGCLPDGGRCYCIRILLLGNPGTWGNTPSGRDPDPLRTWLDGSSTARVDSLVSHLAPITAELLAQYDVVVLRWLKGDQGVFVLDGGDGGQDGSYEEAGRDDETQDALPGAVDDFWTFTPDEVKAFTDWVHSGGGLVSFIGYESPAAEVRPANQLLENFGLSYATDDICADCPNTKCYCWGDTVPVTMVRSEAGSDTAALSHGIKAVGAYHGRSIQIAPGASAFVVAKYEGSNVAVADTPGLGHVFAFGDERVTYPLDWLDPTPNNSDDCKNALGDPMTTATQFQDAQLWSNIVRWAARAQKCSFVLDDPSVTP